VPNIDMKLLVLSDRLRDCYSNHLRIYLDQNQTIGELELSDSSTFHLLMNKGLSVRVFTAKERLHKESLALAWRYTSATLKSETPRSNTTQVRDYMTIWLDSFCSNTTQVQDYMTIWLDSFCSNTTQVRDYMTIWLESFCSNTTQDGYETLCV
jgi:hypothetical protein